MSDTTQAADAGTDGGAPPYDVEAHARNMGWKPRDQWKGDNWIDAPEFVERATTMLPGLQARNKVLDRTVNHMREQLEAQAQQFSELVKSTRKAEEIGYKRAMRELQDRRREAVTSGDVQAFEAVEQEIRELGPAPAPVPDQPPQQRVDPIARDWAERNPWFRTDPVAADAASRALNAVEIEYPDMPLDERLEEVTRRIRRRFPQHFQQQQRRQQQAEPDDDNDNVEVEGEQPPPRRRSNGTAMVATPSTAPGRGAPKPRSFEAMPAEVKKEYTRQAKLLEGRGEAFTKEEYATYYWEQFPEDGT